MIKEVFKLIKGVRLFYLLTIFITLSMLVYHEDGKILKDPISWQLILIPIYVSLAFAFSFFWVEFIIRMSFILPEDDLGDIGYLIACSLMVFCLLISFSYLSNSDNNFNLSILRKQGFIYTCTLYVMSLIAFNTAGR